MTQAESEHLTAAEWERALLTWKSRDKKRGLKEWKSATARGNWSIGGVCATVVNKAVHDHIWGPASCGGRTTNGSGSMQVPIEHKT